MEQVEAALAEAQEGNQIYREGIDNMLEQAHEYKYKHVMDTSAWHRSYRDQLTLERQENLELRCKHIDMAASAARGNEALRNFRRVWEGSDQILALQSQVTEYRQLARFYKRRAYAYGDPDDDRASLYSSDSDIAEPDDHPSPEGMEHDQDSDNGAPGSIHMNA